MKITIVMGAFLPVPPIMGGAIEKTSFALAQEFARAGHEVVMVSRAVPQFPASEFSDGIRHQRVAGFNSPRSLLWLKFLDLIYSLRVRRILPAADVIVTHTFWLPMLLRNERAGKIYIHVGRVPKGQYRFYRHAACFQAGTQAIGHAIAAEVPDLASKISVIPNPTPKPIDVTKPLPVEERDKIILYVGRVHPEKGVHLLIKAVARNADFAGWRLIIVGPAETRFGGGGPQYRDQLQRLAANSSAPIELTGPIFDAAALERQFRAARLFVYPSLAEQGETFGLAPLEAMAHGCAVLVSDLGCFHDFIRDGETGFIFDHRLDAPVETLARKLKSLVANESLLASVAEAGYRNAAEFSLGKIAARFLQDFEKLK